MKNNNKMYRKIKLLFIVIISAFVATIFLGRDMLYAHTLDKIIDGIEEKTFSSATIDEDFADDTVVVVLNKQESAKFSRYSAVNFPELQVECIEEINKNATRIAQSQFVSETIEKSDVRNKIIDNNTYRKVIAIKLQEKSKENVLTAIRLLEQRNEIISATPDYLFHFRSLPNDQSFADSSFISTNGTQWAIDGGTWNIGASDAWNIARGSNEVIVGVIDTGIRATHEDLINRVDAGLSRDFTQSNPVGQTPVDGNGHGTQVSGIIGAQGGNGLGISGVNQNLTLVQLRVGMANWIGVGGTQIATAIDYATETFETERPISILNFSGGSNSENMAVRQAILDYPGLFVTAANNANLNHDTSLDYPTNYSRESAFVNGRNNVISVSSLNVAGNRPNNTAWGATSVSIFAPGADILTTHRTSDVAYTRVSGTSFATPHVAGVAALLMSVNPRLTPNQIKMAIVNSGNLVDITHPSGFLNLGTTTITVRRLNAEAAVASVALFKTRDLSTTAIEITGVVRALTGSVIIPKILDGKIVTQISGYAFSNQIGLTSVTIPNTISFIGNYAFQDCINLTSVSIPPNVSGGYYAFDGCLSLYGVVIHNNENQHLIISNLGSLLWENHIPDNHYYGEHDSHYTYCLTCNMKVYCDDHAIVTSYTSTHHTFTCPSCSYTKTETHNFNINQICIDCGYQSNDPHVHSYDYQYFPTTPGKFGKQHLAYCACGASVTRPCVGNYPPGGGTVHCHYCGQLMSSGGIFFSITLPNGETYVSEAPITLDVLVELSGYLGYSYTQAQLMSISNTNQLSSYKQESVLYLPPKNNEIEGFLN